MPMTHNYTCWLSIYVKDVMQLPERHPEVYRECKHFGAVLSTQFLPIAMVHHMSRPIIPSIPIVISLTSLTIGGNGPSAPNSARIVGEIEEVLTIHDLSTDHHEEAFTLQVNFHKDMKSLGVDLHSKYAKTRNTRQRFWYLTIFVTKISSLLGTNQIKKKYIYIYIGELEEVQTSHDLSIRCRLS